MPSLIDSQLVERYHLTEDYFFTSTSALHQRVNACVNAYFADEYLSAFNLLFVRVGSTQLDDGIAPVLDLIRDISLPVNVAVHQAKVSTLKETLESMDFSATLRTTAMGLDLSAFTASPASDSRVEIRLTENLNDWAGPLRSALELSAESMAHYQARHQRCLDSGLLLFHFNLLVQGEVVCSSTLSMCDDLARLSDIATPITHRGKGYATQLIHGVLAHAITLGATWCFLEASTQGLSLYRKIGFTTLFDYLTFSRGARAEVDVAQC